MKILGRFLVHALDWLGFIFAEIAFQTDCWGPFAYSYRLGCWFYAKADDIDDKYELGIHIWEIVE